MSEEWGPWLENYGLRPVSSSVHVAVEIRGINDPEDLIANPECDLAGNWHWEILGVDGDILRYRVRRPKALQQLIQMVENLPAPSKQYEDA